MSPVSTMGVGVRRDGTVERYQPPPGPTALIVSPGGAPPPLTTTQYTSWQSLTLPAGTYDAWAVLKGGTISPAGMVLSAQIYLWLGTGPALPGQLLLENPAGTLQGLIAATPPVELTLTATETLHVGGHLVMGNITFTDCQLFARPL